MTDPTKQQPTNGSNTSQSRADEGTSAGQTAPVDGHTAMRMLAYAIMNGLVDDLDEGQLREVADGRGIDGWPNMTADGLRAAIHADAAARARADGLPIDDLPPLNSRQARNLGFAVTGGVVPSPDADESADGPHGAGR
jgi:hypothetical protein